ncbi:hypothetical protein [Paenibacillus hamazuiensis]|uniref:hypothetical protein n=1 Tax=Paenibacillus hamazuiensis TaxID=2936508 RepID=UPI00200F1EBE|nr:hypothetical protein [Paenibacillus hamazuiensis]
MLEELICKKMRVIVYGHDFCVEGRIVRYYEKQNALLVGNIVLPISHILRIEIQADETPLKRTLSR